MSMKQSRQHAAGRSPKGTSGAAEAVEEAILNALAAAETMTGFKGTVHALPLDELQAIMQRYRV